jgi:hypothetical protein
LLGVLPYLLFLVCPLMHLLHGHGHGHGRSEPGSPTHASTGDAK